MKIRQGFVSNSSSSNFCIVGVKLDGKKLDNVENKKWFIKEIFECKDNLDDVKDKDELNEIFYTYVNEYNEDDVRIVSEGNSDIIGYSVVDNSDVGLDDHFVDAEYIFSLAKKLASEINKKMKLNCKLGIYSGQEMT